MNLADFKFIKQLGKGAQSSVDLVLHQPTNELYALKVNFRYKDKYNSCYIFLLNIKENKFSR